VRFDSIGSASDDRRFSRVNRCSGHQNRS
jgi:hypothetical protein